jgi:hypothetical protein
MTKKKEVKKEVKNKLVSFRLDAETFKKLDEVAKYKKWNKTEVVKDLIRLAHIGIFSKEAQAVNKIYRDLIMTQLKAKANKEAIENIKTLVTSKSKLKQLTKLK